MSNDHIVQLPKAVWGIKIVQAIVSVLVLAFSAFILAVNPYNGYFAFSLFTALFSGIALVYYFVSLHANKSLFNWIALLVLECFCVLWWLVVWALIAAALSIVVYYDNTYGDYYSYKRSLVKRIDVGTYNAAAILVYVTLALGLINWILYCVTLGFLAMGIHRHRKAGKPMQSGGSSTSGWNMASREEKHDLQPMPAAPSYSAQSNGQAPSPVQAPTRNEQQSQQAFSYPPQQQSPQGYSNSPLPYNTHEVHGGNRYQ